MTSISGCSRGERWNASGAATPARSSTRSPAGFRIRTSPSQADDEQAGRQARDDFAAQALGRVGARRGRALLRLQLGDRLLQRGRQQRGLGAAAARAALGVGGRGGKAQQRERQHRDQRGDQRRQAEQRVAGRCQVHRRRRHDTRTRGLVDSGRRVTAAVVRRSRRTRQSPRSVRRSRVDTATRSSGRDRHRRGVRRAAGQVERVVARVQRIDHIQQVAVALQQRVDRTVAAGQEERSATAFARRGRVRTDRPAASRPSDRSARAPGRADGTRSARCRSKSSPRRRRRPSAPRIVAAGAR